MWLFGPHSLISPRMNGHTKQQPCNGRPTSLQHQEYHRRGRTHPDASYHVGVMEEEEFKSAQQSRRGRAFDHGQDKKQSICMDRGRSQKPSEPTSTRIEHFFF